MERKDFVFVCLLAVSFLLSAAVLAGNGLVKHAVLFQNERAVLEITGSKWNRKPEIELAHSEAHKNLVPEAEFMSELMSAPEVEAAAEAESTSGSVSAPEPKSTSGSISAPEPKSTSGSASAPGSASVGEAETRKGHGENSSEESAIANEASALEAASETAWEAQPQFITVGYEYFDDALFVGDSRMEGIMEYGNLENATFFADSGMSVFKLEKKQLSVPGLGKKSFQEVLTAKQYGKIYLMLGLNELGYQESVVEQKYKEIVELIRENQSEAILYLCANLHVTEAQSQKDAIYNNEKVNWVNEMVSQLADGERCIYIDINEVFDDETGSLNEEYSSDAFHVYAKHYMEWVDWLCTKGI